MTLCVTAGPGALVPPRSGARNNCFSLQPARNIMVVASRKSSRWFLDIGKTYPERVLPPDDTTRQIAFQSQVGSTSICSHRDARNSEGALQTLCARVLSEARTDAYAAHVTSQSR